MDCSLNNINGRSFRANVYQNATYSGYELKNLAALDSSQNIALVVGLFAQNTELSLMIGAAVSDAVASQVAVELLSCQVLAID